MTMTIFLTCKHSSECEHKRKRPYDTLYDIHTVQTLYYNRLYYLSTANHWDLMSIRYTSSFAFSLYTFSTFRTTFLGHVVSCLLFFTIYRHKCFIRIFFCTNESPFRQNIFETPWRYKHVHTNKQKTKKKRTTSEWKRLWDSLAIF